jgi:hypothetical protein
LGKDSSDEDMKTAHLGYLIHFFGMFAGELAELLVLPAAAADAGTK